MSLSVKEKEINLRISEVKAKKPIYHFIKRTFDIAAGLLALVIALPIIAIVCMLVVMESKGSPIYVQERLGKGGRIFKIYKIRSMYMDAEKHTGPKWADKNDSRVTRVGAFIRKRRIDELPQLFNILKGDMSIVGPRPERPYFTEKFESETPGFVNRLQVRPGLTSLSHVNGGYDMDYVTRLEYDMSYIKNRGVLMDLSIIFKTVWVVLSGDGAR